MPICLWLLLFPRSDFRLSIRVRVEAPAPARKTTSDRARLASDLERRLPPHLLRDVLPDGED